jgi:soluble lytic murein transglycosylase-like protein
MKASFGKGSRRPAGPDFVESALAELQCLDAPRLHRGRPLGLLAAGLIALLIGATMAAPNEAPQDELQARIQSTEAELAAREGELQHVRLEMNRLQEILSQSARHGIPADLAAAIHDIAVAEGVDPSLAFSLVRVESSFATRAVSPKGAIGLTQVMPATAFELEPGIRLPDLFDEETNLRLGFRYLGRLIRVYRGDLRLALLAYNRGPTRVDSIRRAGGDPANGYARKVLKNADR